MKEYILPEKLLTNLKIDEDDYPVVVDLDGTFIKTDLLHEGIIILLRRNPLNIFVCINWWLKGKVFLKNQVYKSTSIKYELLPINEEVLNFIEAEKDNGRNLVLATASLITHAKEIMRIYPIFNEVYGTGDINLKGKNKLNVLVNEFGYSHFDYIGNSRSDLKIFTASRYSYLVNPSKSLERKTRYTSNVKHVWKSKVSIVDYLKAIRIYQWLKNLLIFVPFITSHSFSISHFFQAVAGFFAFSLVASSGYLVNDLFDLNMDRVHPRKRFRPFASGKIPILPGLILACILLVTGLLIGSQLNFSFFMILATYFVVSFSYSMYFKKMVLYDVFILASLYSIRVIAGGLASNIHISFWLILFSTFIFLSLAFVKRISELRKIKTGANLLDRGRGYSTLDINLIEMMGIASGFLSVVVFSLYINSPEVSILYSHPKVLWPLTFLFLIWISRIWVVTNRGEMTDDPIVFAIKDKGSYLILALIGLTIYFAI